jgi:hypothetical protein
MRLGRRLRITVYRPARYHVRYGVRDWCLVASRKTIDPPFVLPYSDYSKSTILRTERSRHGK